VFHVVTIQTKVHDPHAVAAACRRLNLAAPVQGTAKLYSGGRGPCRCRGTTRMATPRLDAALPPASVRVELARPVGLAPGPRPCRGRVTAAARGPK
jgi:hypothetical protein